MLDAAVDFLLTLLLVVGLPALFVVFVLKGAIIGKPLPTTLLLPGYVIAISASGLEIAVVVVTTATGYVCGQLLVYAGARRGGISHIRSAPRVTLSEQRLEQAEDLFEKYGGLGIFVTNFVPYLRGLIMVPAGIAAYPATRVALYVFTSTLLYHVVIVAIAIGALRLLF